MKMQTLPSEVNVDAKKVPFIKTILLEILLLVTVLMNVCLVSILHKIQMLKVAYHVMMLVLNAGDLPLKNVSNVLHGPTRSKVKKVYVYCNALQGM
jgi:hypothetical protein